MIMKTKKEEAEILEKTSKKQRKKNTLGPTDSNQASPQRKAKEM